MRIEAGTVVHERLKIVRPLGRGGMGSVWVGRHEALDIEVAVKFIAPELAEARDPTILARFRREAQLAAKLDGPNVVRILDHGVTGDEVPYIVMELLRGETLAERIAARGKLAPAEVVNIVAGVGEGLAHAHELGIVHRDIKPQNIFLTRGRAGQPSSAEVAKILDFGIARSDAPDMKAATAAGSIVGTLPYMSPELLLEAGSPDKSADLWALAVVAYEALTGRQPFVGETAARVMMSITRGAFERASGAGAPEASDAFFERALAPDRAGRFASAPELADALRAALAGAVSHPSSAEPAGAATVRDEEAFSTEAFVAQRGLGFAHTVAGSASGPGESTETLPVAGARTPSPAEPPVNTLASPALPATAPLDSPRVARPGLDGGSARPRSRALLVAGGVLLLGVGAVYWVRQTSAPEATPAGAASAQAVASATSRGSSQSAGDGAAMSAASPLATPSASAEASRPAVLLPCPDGVRTQCKDGAQAWCDPSDRPVGCCAPGLVSVGDEKCACAPGGTTHAEAMASGCLQGSNEGATAAIQTVIRGRFSEFRVCYEEALARNAKLKGRLSLRFEIGPDGVPGRVGLANAGVPDPEFQDCLMGKFSGLRFDPPVNGHVKITYPLAFGPGD